ncbi:MAG: DUF58 domain-containing protein [Lachnospiraceae bacterium]|nr:DUF58 domain-containing protein [Lachnospiraceae bacterium]
MPVLFLLVGFWLVIYILSRYYKRIWNRGLSTQISFVEDSVNEGQEGTLIEVVKNEKNFPLPILHVKFQTSRKLDFHQNENVNVSDLTYKNDLFAVMPYQQIRRTLRFTALKRGYYTIDHLDLVGSFLFFDFFCYDRHEASTYIYVYPSRIGSGAVLDFNRQVIWTLLSRNRMYEDPFSFAGIRQYQPYDPMKRINWSASAKTGDLMVNVYDYCAGQPVVLIVNLQKTISWHVENLLEESLRIAVTIAENLMENGVGVNVLTTYDTLGTQFYKVPGNNMEEIDRKLATIDLSVNSMDYDRWMQEYLLPSFNDKYLYAVVSYDESAQMVAANEALALKQDGLCLYRPVHDGDKLPGYSGRILSFERRVNRND